LVQELVGIDRNPPVSDRAASLVSAVQSTEDQYGGKELKPDHTPLTGLIRDTRRRAKAVWKTGGYTV